MQPSTSLMERGNKVLEKEKLTPKNSKNWNTTPQVNSIQEV